MANCCRLKSKLRPLAASETEELLLLKKRDLEARQASTGAPKSEVEPKFYVWDRSYYLNIQKKHEFSIDHSKVAEYFEIHTTIAAMLRIFEQLFAMKFERLQTSVWHQDVAAYSVWNSEDKESGFLGYLYVDPLARPGKRKGIGYTLGLKHVSTVYEVSVYKIDHTPGVQRRRRHSPLPTISPGYQHRTSYPKPAQPTRTPRSQNPVP